MYGNLLDSPEGATRSLFLLSSTLDSKEISRMNLLPSTYAAKSDTTQEIKLLIHRPNVTCNSRMY